MNPVSCIFYLIINYLGFTISPARVEKALLGAELITEVFEIQNFSNDSLRIRIEFEDFDIAEDGKVTFFLAGTIKNSIAPYSVINPEEIFIAPQNREYIRVTFRIPENEKVEEYYGMLLFKSQPIPTRYQPMITIAGEIGVPIYYSVANLIVKDASFDSLYILNDSINIVFKNAGNIHLRVKGEAKILRYDETIIEKDSISEFVVLPKRLRKIKLPLKEQLEQGNYIIRVKLDYGAIQLLEGERRFIK